MTRPLLTPQAAPIAASGAAALTATRKRVVIGATLLAVITVAATVFGVWFAGGAGAMGAASTGAWLAAAMGVPESAAHVLAAAAAAGIASLAGAGAFWMLFVRRSVGVLRKAEGRMRTLTLIDPLTGLLNRAGLHRRMERAVDAGAGGTIGVLLIDVDRFRLVNESLGQGSGDELLREVARRIFGVLRAGDVAARLNGDQFAIVSAKMPGAQAAAVMANNVLRAIESKLVIGSHEAPLSVSIGIALAKPGTPDANGARAARDARKDAAHNSDGAGDTPAPDELLAQADAAMRAAKAAGGGRSRVFDATMLADANRRLELDMALRRAAQTGGFEIAFQPIMAVDGRSVEAVEALLRWTHPERGAVSPTEFIPLLEQNGLIVPVGLWILRESCRRVQGWAMHGTLPITLSVNVSPIQFAEPDFVRDVLAALETSGFPAQHLQLEVTEGMLLDPTADLLRKVDALVDAGVRLAVDDFGMGYSSLVYLKRLRLHSLKIDRMFVRDVPGIAKDTAIVRAIVDLAHALELSVTAEGVETVEQCAALAGLGCDSLQGYLFAKPMPAALMLEHLLTVQGHDDGPAPRDWSTTMAVQLEGELAGAGR